MNKEKDALTSIYENFELDSALRNENQRIK